MAVVCEAVGRSFATASGTVAALSDVDARFDGGAVHVVVGSTGSGKSTLLRLLAGTDQPTTGRVLIDGDDLSRIGVRARRAVRRRSIGIVLQRPGANLLPYLTAVEHLHLAARLRHGRRATDANDVLGLVGLAARHHHRPAELSGGEQQRLAFAAAVTGGPAVVIADEPTAELDRASADLVLDAVAELRRLGTCLILSSHDPAVLTRADHVLHLDRGTTTPSPPFLSSLAGQSDWAEPTPPRTEPVPIHRRREAPVEVLIELAAVGKSYRRGREEVQALRSVSLALAAGEVVGLVGPSGSGKTTLLNLVCGWEEPDEGTLSGSVAPTRAGRRSSLPGWDEVAIVAQGLGLAPELTVRENVALAGRLSSRSPTTGTDDVDRRLSELGLVDLADRYPAETSLGEQQRTAVARALALDPALVLADEPTAHQDARHGDLVLAALRRRADGGGGCLVATHDPRLLPHLDRVLRLADGRLVG